MHTPIRILESITPTRIGGAEIYVTNLCGYLAAQGDYVELFCPRGRPLIDYAARRGLSVRSWKTHGKIDPVTLVRLARLLKTSPFDIIHTHLSTASLLGALAAKLAGLPSVAHVHGLNSAACFRYSDIVVAVSNAVKEHLCAQGMASAKIRVIHNGIDIDSFTPLPLEQARLKFGYDIDHPVFGVFGRLSPEKGQRTAVEALWILLKDFPHARLILVGQGKDLDELQTAAAALGIRDRVDFAGFVEDVRGLMSACDAVLVPSLKEGFGLAAVEAMALQRPVVAAITGGLPEIVEPGHTGLLFAPGDPQAAADALKSITLDKGEAQRMGKLGRERAADMFNLKQKNCLVQTLLHEATTRM